MEYEQRHTFDTSLEKANSVIIKVYIKDLSINTSNKASNKVISQDELIKDLQNNGLKVLRLVFSKFANCYFIEVKGLYKGKIKQKELYTKPKDFNWVV